MLHGHKKWTRESGTIDTYPVLLFGGVTHENKEVKYLHEEPERIYRDNEGAVGMNEWQTIEYPQHAIHRRCQIWIWLEFLCTFLFPYSPNSWPLQFHQTKCHQHTQTHTHTYI